ncbi:TPA: hypothetical protein ACOEHG_002704 [Enterobacter ludwigii]
MNKTNALKAINKVDEIITDIFCNGVGTDIDDKLHEVITNIAEARQAVDEYYNAEAGDSVTAAIIILRKLCVAANRYISARFTEEDKDNENEDFIMFWLLIDLAGNAYKKLKIAENEIFN